MQRTLVLSLLVLGTSCGDTVRAPLTIVVDTDRARALEDQGRLQELRTGVQGDRAELEAARGELQAARRRLEEAAQGNTSQRAQALADVQALEARLGLARGVGGGITREELEAALTAHENRLGAIIAAELDRAKTGAQALPPASTSSTPLAVAAPAAARDLAGEARRQLASAQSTLAAKGLVTADVDGGTASVDRVTSALQRGDGAAALEVATALAASAASAVADGPLLRRKYDRLNTLLKRGTVNAERRAQGQQLLGKAASALSSSDFANANARLNEVAALLGS